jgi:hypothetical protein
MPSWRRRPQLQGPIRYYDYARRKTMYAALKEKLGNVNLCHNTKIFEIQKEQAMHVKQKWKAFGALSRTI